MVIDRTIKKILSIFFAISILSGCATIQRYNEIDLVVDTFLSNIKSGDFAGSYNYFSASLKQNITEQKHEQFLTLVTQKLGTIERFRQKRLLPFQLLDDEMFKEPLKSGGSSISSYCVVDFTKGEGEIYLSITKEAGQIRINEFVLTSSQLENDQEFIVKAKAIGVWDGD